MGRRVAADTPEHDGYREQVAVPAAGLIEVPEGLGMADSTEDRSLRSIRTGNASPPASSTSAQTASGLSVSL